jgi:hypothetical protein
MCLKKLGTSGTSRTVFGGYEYLHPYSCTMALRLTQPLTEMSTTNLPGGKGRLVSGADNLTAICEQIV